MVKIITIATGIASLLALVQAEELTPKYAPFPKHIKKRQAPVNSTIVVETTIVQKTVTETEGKTSDSGITITKQSVSSRSAQTTKSSSQQGGGGNPILSDVSSVISQGVSVLTSKANPSPSKDSSSSSSTTDPDTDPTQQTSSSTSSPSSTSTSPANDPPAPSTTSTTSTADGGLPLTSAIGSVLSSIVSKATSILDPPVPTPSPSSSSTASAPGQPDPSSTTTTTTPNGPGLPATSVLQSIFSSATSQLGSIVSSATASGPLGPGPATSTNTPPPPQTTTTPAGPPNPGSILSSATSAIGSVASSVASSLTAGPPGPGPSTSTNVPPPPTATSSAPVNSNPVGSIISSATSGLPIGGTSTSIPVSVPTGAPTGVPSNSIPSVSVTSIPSAGPPGSSSTASAASSSSAAIIVPVSSAASAPTQAYPSTGPQSIRPTATDTLTSLYMPSTIIFDPTASTAASSVATASGIPTTLPGQLQNPFNGGTIPQQPAGNTLCNFAFTKELDYTFVVSTPYAVKEIFYYTPKAVQYALNTTDANVPQMHTLRPYDTSSSGYITTLAYFWLPNNMVDNLQGQLLAANSWLHRNESGDPQTDTFITLIDYSFPLRAQSIANPTGGSAAPTNNPDPGNLSGSQSSSSSSVNPTAVGAGVGAVAGAALYGAIMFFVARRYRKRRAGHSRSSSVIDTSSMAQSHGEMMTGAGSALMAGHHEGFYGTNGRISRESGSSRGRDISAPMMAENSLGWN